MTVSPPRISRRSKKYAHNRLRLMMLIVGNLSVANADAAFDSFDARTYNLLASRLEDLMLELVRLKLIDQGTVSKVFSVALWAAEDRGIELLTPWQVPVSIEARDLELP